MNVFPLPRECFERLISQALRAESLHLFISALTNEAFAALLTIILVGREKWADSEINFSYQEFWSYFFKELAELENYERRNREYFLERVGGLDIYIREGLKEADFVGLRFIELSDYWKRGLKQSDTVGCSVAGKDLSLYLEKSPVRNVHAGNNSYQFTSETTVTPTTEQKEIIEAVRLTSNEEVLKVEAFAGTGKTTLCSFLAETTKSEKIGYLVYNRFMSEQGSNKLAPHTNVDCLTLDKLAYKSVRPWEKWGEQRLQRDKKIRYSDLVDRLGLPEKPGGNRRGLIIRQIHQTVLNFCYSRDAKISLRHLPPGSWSQGIEEDIVEWANDLWARILSPSEDIPIEPPYVMKVWDLQEGTLPYEFVLLDEAQDANAAFMSILARSLDSPNFRCLLIGDHYQQLYGWRGSINSMRLFEGQSYHMTQSFRFGTEIATLANQILAVATDSPRYPIIGNYGVSSQVIPYSLGYEPEWPVTILGRTNGCVFKSASKIAERGHKLHIVGGIEELEWLLLDALKLYRGQAGN